MGSEKCDKTRDDLSKTVNALEDVLNDFGTPSADQCRTRTGENRGEWLERKLRQIDQMLAHYDEAEKDYEASKETLDDYKCEPICYCMTPNAGTIGRNKYSCDDGSEGQCGAKEKCFATGKFSKKEIKTDV